MAAQGGQRRGPIAVSDLQRSFKIGRVDADAVDVDDGYGGLPALMYDPGAEGGAAVPPPPESGFSFDLDSALDRMDSGEAPAAPASPPPLRAPASDEVPSALEQALSALPLPDGAPAAAPTPVPTPAPITEPAAEPTIEPPVQPPPIAEPVAAPAPPPAPAPTPEPLSAQATVPSEPAPSHDVLPSRSTAPAPASSVFGGNGPTPDDVGSSLPTRQPSSALPPSQDVGDGLPVRQPSSSAHAATAPVDDRAGGLPVRRPAGATAAPQAEAPPAALPDDEELQRRPWAAESVDAPGTQVASPKRSVFDDLGSSTNSPMLSPGGMAGGAATDFVGGGMTTGFGGSGHASPQIPTMPPGTAPVLPDVIPVMSPVPSKEPDGPGAAIPDVRAMRSAQLKASRQQRQGKVFGRSVIAFFFIAGLIGAALVFGRPYLFATEWDARLVPAVDDVQTARGIEFDEAVPAVEQPAQRYGLTMSTILLGDDWADRLPEWRALGLATGVTTAETVATRMATVRAAIYDPDTATIYLNADADFETAQNDLRLAVEQAFSHQMSIDPEPIVADEALLGEAAEDVVPGFAGLIPIDRLVSEAVDRAVTQTQHELVGDESDVDTQPFPVPIAYQVTAMNQLGGVLLDAAAIDPFTVRVGDSTPTLTIRRLDDGATEISVDGALADGDISVIEPVALGTDDWSLVWGARLPVSSVDLLAASITGDSYRVVDRGGRICSIAVFETASAETAVAVNEALQVWGSTAPNETGTVVTPLDGNRIQIEACDPNMIAGTPSLTSVAHVIGQQIQRLS